MAEPEDVEIEIKPDDYREDIFHASGNIDCTGHLGHIAEDLNRFYRFFQFFIFVAHHFLTCARQQQPERDPDQLLSTTKLSN